MLLQFDEMRVELIKEQQREIVAAPWTMWDATACC
jgi:hypothetical protein